MKTLAEMTVVELEAEMKSAYGAYMYEECAERGYDAKASREANDCYIAAKLELDKRNMADQE